MPVTVYNTELGADTELNPLARVRDYISAVRWKATTHVSPHEYTVREWNADLEREFENCVRYIRALGYDQRFGPRRYRYCDIDGYSYWTMGAPLAKTTVINRRARRSGRPGTTGGRKSNSAYRQREHLTEDEVFRLMESARDNRYGARDSALIFCMYRHGLRVSEACALDWSAIDFAAKELHVRRSKLGKSATHPIRGDELRALRRVHREAGAPRHGPVFVSERGTAFTRDGINKLVARAGEAAGFDYRVHPHMLRHACGFALAKAGHDTRRLQDYLGHKSIGSTVRYTELDAGKFQDFWR